jgi:hypothetical protein
LLRYFRHWLIFLSIIFATLLFHYYFSPLLPILTLFSHTFSFFAISFRYWLFSISHWFSLFFDYYWCHFRWRW